MVDYIAANAAQLGPPKLYERLGEDEREERGDHPAAETLREPNPAVSGVGLMATMVRDLLIFDNAFVYKTRKPSGTLELWPLPAASMGLLGRARFSLDGFRYHLRDGTTHDFAPEEIIHWHGYNPDDPRKGTSKMETLRNQLAEETATQRAQVELAKSGLNQLGHIERPLEAPEWSAEASERFQEDFSNQMREQARRYPVLEEGMEFKPSQMSPKDAQMLQSREFTREEVCKAYGMKAVPPTDEYESTQFLRDVLAPLLDDYTAMLGVQVLRESFPADAEALYFDVPLDEKLQGDERLKALVSAAGAAVLTRNEARARLNLEALPEGEGLVTPLNVLVGENPKPSPAVMGPQLPGGPEQDGSGRAEDDPAALAAGAAGAAGSSSANGRHKALEITTQPIPIADMSRQRRHIDKVTATLERFYKRQLRKIRGKGTFDSDRWNRELAADLNEVLGTLISSEGGIYVARLGGVDFDSREVANYVKAMAANVAEDLNRVTQRTFEGDSTGPEALEQAIAVRAGVAGRSLGTKATVFARREAAKQAPQTAQRMQMWIADTERHADLDGAVVPLGSDWGGIEPGSEPNCACSMAIL